MAGIGGCRDGAENTLGPERRESRATWTRCWIAHGWDRKESRTEQPEKGGSSPRQERKWKQILGGLLGIQCDTCQGLELAAGCGNVGLGESRVELHLSGTWNL